MKLLKLIYFLSFLLLISNLASAQSFKQVMDCHKSLIATAFEHYIPDRGQLICEDINSSCYLTYDDLDTYKIDIPTTATFTVKEILLDRPDLQTAYHHILSWVDPKNSKTVYVDVVLGDTAYKYGRTLIDLNAKIAATLTPYKSDSKFAQEMALKRIESQLDVISKNIVEKSFPYGQDISKFKELNTKRLSDCAYMVKVQNLLIQLKQL